MKRILCLIMVAMVAMLTVGCATQKTTNLGVSFWIDEERGVEYVIYESYYGAGITPRL
jgi:hypothetical protein